MVVHRHAGFPRHARAETGGGNPLLGRAVVAHASLALVHAGHAGAPLADPVVDDDLGLQPAHVIVEVHAALVRPGFLPFAVEPENPNRSVAVLATP